MHDAPYLAAASRTRTHALRPIVDGEGILERT
jgi:hypothetical protein